MLVGKCTSAPGCHKQAANTCIPRPCNLSQRLGARVLQRPGTWFLAAAPDAAAAAARLARAVEGQHSSAEPTAAAAPPSAAAEATPAQQAAAAQTAAAGWSFTQQQQGLLWGSVSRALLRLGRSGATPSHGRSLTELLGAHKLVKVQLNGTKGDDAEVGALAASLQAQAGDAAVLLQAKGATLLFGSRSCSQEELLAVAEAEAAGTDLWRAKRQAKRAQAAAKRGPAAPST